MSSFLRTVEECQVRKKNPLSVILERSAEDGSVLNATHDSMKSEIPERDRPQKRNKEMMLLQSSYQKQPEMDFSDSEFCSSNTAIDKLAQDEAERLLFHNSKLDSFLADAVSFNASTKVTDESIGAYFQRRSSNPIKERGRDASYFQKTLEAAELGDNSGFLQPTPCDASTPKPQNSSNWSINQRSLSLSAILQGASDRPRRSSQSNSRHSSMLPQDPNSSLLQGLQDTNGSICSMAKIFRGPDSSRLGSQDMMAQVLQYCQARSIITTDSNIGESFFDSSRYSEFRENLQQTDESSATSKSTNTSEGSPNDTIVGPVSPTAAEHHSRSQNGRTVASGGNDPTYRIPISIPAATSESITISATNTLTYVIPQPPKTNLIQRGDGKRRPRPENRVPSARNTEDLNVLRDNHNQNIPSTTNFQSLQSEPKPGSLTVSAQSSEATTSVQHTTSESEKHFPYPWNVPNGHPQVGGVAVGVHPQNPFPAYGFPFVIQIQCPCHRDHTQQSQELTNRNSVHYSHQCCANSTSQTTQMVDPEASVHSTTKQNHNYQAPIVKQEQESFECSSVGIPPTSPPSEVPNIRVDKAIVAFSKTGLGELKTAILTIQNKSDFNVYLDCGIRKSQDPCFWNYSENTAPNCKTSIKLILHKFSRKSLTIAFQPTREGQVLGSYIIKFQKAESDSDDYATIYRTEVQLTGIGIAAPPRPIHTKPKLLSKHPWC